MYRLRIHVRNASDITPLDYRDHSVLGEDEEGNLIYEFETLSVDELLAELENFEYAEVIPIDP